MIRISNIKLQIGQSEEELLKKIRKILKNDKINEFKISKKSIDARDKKNIFFVYSVDINIQNEKKYLKIKNVSEVKNKIYKVPVSKSNKRPVVVGSGPSGLFCALVLAESGLAPIILERGKPVHERAKDVSLFFEKGILNEESNVQFGEGGAGTFSDGKLTTGVNDDRIKKVLDEFINAGAPEEIGYLAKPHIGTDKLINVLVNIRKKIENLGGEFRFSCKMTNIITENEKLLGLNCTSEETEIFLETDFLVLALGHSARDTFRKLFEKSVFMTPKAFSVGMRIEHNQKEISKSQFGDFYKKLPPAEYKLNYRTKNNRGVYTFCMCPGGTVVASASSKNHVVTNGMSNFRRDGENANSALLVGVSPSDFYEDDVLSGIKFQEEFEKKAFILGGKNYKAPVQLLGDFLLDIPTKKIGNIEPSYKPGYTFCDFREIFPEDLISSFKEGAKMMDKKLHGFNTYDAVLTGVETRSSSPVTIQRNSFFESNISGIYPVGEGAGYAGGIMSAAVDGIKCAEQIIAKLN